MQSDTPSGDYFLSNYERSLFEGRYQDPGSDTESTWEDAFRRVGHAVAEGSVFETPEGRIAFEEEIIEMMVTGQAIPSSPQVWNYGSARRHNRCGSSCYTGELGDTLEDFATTNSHAESVYVASGGFGVCGNKARPRGTKITYAKSCAVGILGRGGPLDRIERTTGYITNGGRERGAAMFQLSAWHPDAVEFILAKVPVSLGFLDDWRANACAMLGAVDSKLLAVIDLYTSKYVFRKEWPTADELMPDLLERDAGLAFGHMISVGVIAEDSRRRMVPRVFDWALSGWREANRDWDLPMQNCNMSLRIPDALFNAVENNEPWVLSWFSKEKPKQGEYPWTKTDLGSGKLETFGNGDVFDVNEERTEVFDIEIGDDTQHAPNNGNYRYAVLITTWEGLLENLKPNPNNWKETEYARRFRNVIVPTLERYGKGTIMARDFFDLIVRTAWECGDPGLVSEDTYERFNPVDSEVYGVRISNPCSEYVSPPGGSCNLISLNLRLAAETINTREDKAELRDLLLPGIWNTSGFASATDWEYLMGTRAFATYLAAIRAAAKRAFKYIAHAAEFNKAPVEYIDRMTREHFRTVGVGIMGLAEALMLFHVAYGSACAQRFAASTMAEIYLTCWEESFRLAEFGGWPKPKGWNPDRMRNIFDARIEYAEEYVLLREQRHRLAALQHNIDVGLYATHTAVTSVAPTGTIAQIAGWLMSRLASNGVAHNISVNSGLEPAFSWAVGRQDNNGHAVIYHDLWLQREHYGKSWMRKASSIPAEDHVRMQAAVCAFTCMSASKTINLPEDATAADVAAAYTLAHRLGIPGTAVYRDRSKPMQVLTALDCPSGDCKVDSDAGWGKDAPANA